MCKKLFFYLFLFATIFILTAQKGQAQVVIMCDEYINGGNPNNLPPEACAKSLIVAPNPFSTQFDVTTCGENFIVGVQMHDLNGTEWLNVTIDTEAVDCNVSNTLSLPSGYYQLTVETAVGGNMKRLIQKQ
jgi:hypothetical protein